MNAKRFVLGAMGIVGLVVAMGRRAHADEGGGLRADLAFGGAMVRTATASTGEVGDPARGTLALTLTTKAGRALVGGSAEAAISLFGQQDAFLSADGGLIKHLGEGHVVLLGEAGGHVIGHIADGFLTQVSGRTVILPYAGFRVGIVETPRPDHAALGFWLTARADLARVTTRIHREVFTDVSDTNYQVGGYTVGLAFGWSFGAK